MEKENHINLSRRRFLKGAVAAGFTILFSALPETAHSQEMPSNTYPEITPVSSPGATSIESSGPITPFSSEHALKFGGIVVFCIGVPLSVYMFFLRRLTDKR